MEKKFKHIDWPALLSAFGLTLIVSAIITGIFLLGKYAPGVLLGIVAALLMGFFYCLIKMME